MSLEEEEARETVIARCKEELTGTDLTWEERKNVLNFLERDITQRSFCKLYKVVCCDTIESHVN